MTPRAPSLPGVPQAYAGNDAGPKPPRVLRGTRSEPYAEVIGDRIWIGYRLGETRHASTSFSRAEWAALKPMLRAADAKWKAETVDKVEEERAKK